MSRVDRDKGRKGFVSRSAEFADLIGPSATLRLLLRVPSGKALFHEAGVYLANSHSVYISSNRLPCERGRQYATITRVPVDKIPAPAFGKVDRPSIVEPLQDAAKLWHELEIVKDLPQDLAMPNGAAPWKSLSNGQQEGVLWCAQGHHDLDGDGSPEVESALVCMTVDERGRPSETEVALDAFQGKRFSSLNDVVIHAQSGCVFFTDPDYGIGQSFKRSGVGVDGYAPNALYVWHPASGEVRMVDDDYHEPNGVTFVRDPSDPTSGKGYLVTTDTGRFTFKANGNMGVLIVDETRPACVYTYIIEPSPHPALDPFPIVRVDERQLLWESECGAPDGVHPDDNGNIWVGHGDGLHVYNPQTRQLIGKVLLPGGKGVANFCWAGRAGTDPRTGRDMYRILLFAEDELWEACVAVNGRD